MSSWGPACFPCRITHSFIMNFGTENFLLGLVGASGWTVALALAKFYISLRKDVREARKEERNAREAQARTADVMNPFVMELNSPPYIGLLTQIQRSNGYNADGSPFNGDQMLRLRDYPAKLEQIGGLILVGKLLPSEVFECFGKEVLDCKNASFLWKGEDMNYWKLFNVLANAMEEQQSKEFAKPNVLNGAR